MKKGPECKNRGLAWLVKPLLCLFFLVALPFVVNKDEYINLVRNVTIRYSAYEYLPTFYINNMFTLYRF